MDWVLGIRSPALTVFFSTITHLASSWFLVLFLPLGFWLWRKGTFGRLAVLNLFTLLLNTHLKVFYEFPRPDSSFYLTGFSSWSFPSGHAQHAVVTWMWLAWEIGKPWSWVAGTFFTLSIAFSRIYLGVHFGRDVVAGLLAGGATFVYFMWLWAKLPVGWRKLVGMLLLFQVVWLFLTGGGLTLVGFLPSATFVGFGCGLFIKPRLGLTWNAFITLVLAGSIWLIINRGGYFSIDSTIPAFLHFTLYGAWMSFIAPGFLQKLRMVE
jgi:membrane-associated phospholipid phosphatase